MLDVPVDIGYDKRPARLTGVAIPRDLDGLLYVHLRFLCEHRAKYISQCADCDTERMRLTARVREVAADFRVVALVAGALLEPKVERPGSDVRVPVLLSSETALFGPRQPHG